MTVDRRERNGGWLLMLTSVAYVVAAAARYGPIRLRGLELPLPSGRLAAAQLGISILDWTLAGAVLYVLLPEGVPFLAVLGAFLASQLLGLASHVPGGVGVFEGLMVLLLKPFVPSTMLLPALIAYRAVYYLLPLSMALLVLLIDELHLRRADAARLGTTFGWLSEQLTPRLLSAFTFFAGMALLFSGATPAAVGRLRLLDRVFPLGVVEASHFIGSVVGAALLVLSQGLSRRLNTAHVLLGPGPCRRHRRVADEGRRLRGSRDPGRGAPGRLACPTRIRSPGRAVQCRPHLPRAGRQHHRGLSPARVHDAARQGPDHRHRMRDPRSQPSRSADDGVAACAI